MSSLKTIVEQAVAQGCPSGFSVYSSSKIQHILNVPFTKPTLICVLSGSKSVGRTEQEVCHAGEFIFFGDGIDVDMRNIPKGDSYYALLIEFEAQDFELFEEIPKRQKGFFTGSIPAILSQSLEQFVAWVNSAPQALLPLRRQELLQVLAMSGYPQIAAMMSSSGLLNKVQNAIRHNLSEDLTAPALASSLGMSESTLRRKLSAEGTQFQTLKNQIALSKGLHLIQSTDMQIGHIAAEAGYQSQSRFSDMFKNAFGLTPSELRKTRMTE